MSAAAYTKEDKELLMQIIKKYPVVENKKTDATFIKKKNDAWFEITKEYNSCRRGEKRVTIQLKRCWDKIKRKMKNDLAEERRNRKTMEYNSESERETFPCEDIIYVPELNLETNCGAETGKHFLSAKKSPRSQIDDLIKIKIENAKLEQAHLIQIQEIQLKTEKEKFEKAVIDRKISEMQLKLLEKEKI